MSDSQIQLTLIDRLKRIKSLHTEIAGLFKNSVEKIIEIGEELYQVKLQLDHGQFGDWVETNFPFSKGTAARWMSLAQNKKAVLKALSGNKALKLTEAYTLKAASVITSKPAPQKLGPGFKQVAEEAVDQEFLSWENAGDDSPKNHCLHAKGGKVYVLKNGNPSPHMVCNVLIDPPVGMEKEWVELNVGLKALFSQWYCLVENQGKPKTENKIDLKKPPRDVTPEKSQLPPPVQSQKPAAPKRALRGMTDSEDEEFHDGD